jgi:hypothetical protein
MERYRFSCESCCVNLACFQTVYFVERDSGGGRTLTPTQRLRQLEPSWLRSGQTTSLFASVIERDDVKDDLGGILKFCNNTMTPPNNGYVGRYRGVLWRGGAMIDRQLVSDKIASKQVGSKVQWTAQSMCKWPAMPEVVVTFELGWLEAWEDGAGVLQS